MYPRLLQAPERKSFFLLGPRGTGKSLWVRTTFPQGLYLDLLESSLYHSLLAAPDRLARLIPPGFKDWIILDEIQRVPELLNEVHRLIEARRLKFVLTGSSARKLRGRGTNLLAGRALTFHLYPLTREELGGDFDVKRSLRYGQLPSVYVERNPQQYLESYVGTYLREEVQQEGLTRNLAAFSRFLEAASFSQASVLNISAVARDCAMERKAVEGYFNILEDLLLSVRLAPFTRRAKRRLAQHPKFYFFDAGLFRTLRPRGPLDLAEEIDGASLETLLFQELRAQNAYRHLGYNLFFWRAATGEEVDFVLYGERGLVAIEVERSSRVRREDLKSLRAFLADYPMAKTYLVYAGDRSSRDGEIEILSLEECLNRLPQLL